MALVSIVILNHFDKRSTGFEGLFGKNDFSLFSQILILQLVRCRGASYSRDCSAACNASFCPLAQHSPFLSGVSLEYGLLWHLISFSWDLQIAINYVSMTSVVCSGTVAAVVKYNLTAVSIPHPCWSKMVIASTLFLEGSPVGSLDSRTRWYTVWQSLPMKKRAQC